MLARIVAGMIGVAVVFGLATTATAINKEFYGGQEGLRCAKIVVRTTKGTYHGQLPCRGEGDNPHVRFRTNIQGMANDESPTKVAIFVHGRPVIFSVEADVFNRNRDSLYIAFVGIFASPKLTPVLTSKFEVDHFPTWMGLERLFTDRWSDHLRREWARQAETKGFKIANDWRKFFRME